MTLLFALVALGVILGAASYATTPVFLTAAAVIAAWLLAFFVRERLASRRHH